MLAFNENGNFFHRLNKFLSLFRNTFKSFPILRGIMTFRLKEFPLIEQINFPPSTCNREREKNVSFKTTLPHRRCSIFTPRALFHYRDAEVYTEQRHLIRAQSVLQIDCFSTCQRARAAERTSYRLRNVYRQRKYIYIYIYHPQFARAQYTTI